MVINKTDLGRSDTTHVQISMKTYTAPPISSARASERWKLTLVIQRDV